MEDDLKCSNAIQSMEKRVRAACNASDARIDNVAKVNVLWLIVNIDYSISISLVVGFWTSDIFFIYLFFVEFGNIIGRIWR